MQHKYEVLPTGTYHPPNKDPCTGGSKDLDHQPLSASLANQILVAHEAMMCISQVVLQRPIPSEA